MLCENCGKNPASFHYKQSINGEEQTWHLCAACASSQNHTETGPQAGWNAFFSGLSAPAKVKESTEGPCRVCGASASWLAKTGRVGCSSCYQVFGGLLAPYLARLYGKAAHTGRRPKSAGPAEPAQTLPGDELDRLLRLQADAIRHERFEEAAKLRDEINRLKSENGGDTV